MSWKCAKQEAGRSGFTRCAEQCPSCRIWWPPVDGERTEERDTGFVASTADAPSTTALETYSGKFFDFADPSPDQIDLADIARALSETCRFGGHVKRTLSVAEHAVFVRRLVIEAGHPELALAALHHDSHEAYLGDWPTPLKRAVSATFLTRLQERTDEAIGAYFGINPDLFSHPVVKAADEEALYREAATLKPSQGVGLFWGRFEPAEPLPEKCWGLLPRDAEAAFLRAHEEDFTRCA